VTRFRNQILNDQDYENNDTRDTEATDEVQIIAAEGKVTEKTFARIRDGLYDT
jgi:hypothetical protein